jgi:hypothetical protein
MINSGAAHSMCGKILLFFNLCRCRPSAIAGKSGAQNALVITGVGSDLVKLVSGREPEKSLMSTGIVANIVLSSHLYNNPGITTTFGQGATLSCNKVPASYSISTNSTAS